MGYDECRVDTSVVTVGRSTQICESGSRTGGARSVNEGGWPPGDRVGFDVHYGSSPIVGTFDVQRPSSLPFASNRMNVGVTLTCSRSEYSLLTLLNVKFTRRIRPLFHSPVSLLTAGI